MMRRQATSIAVVPFVPIAVMSVLLAGGCKHPHVIELSGGDDRCPIQGCGSNTPVLAGSRYIEALNLDGVPAPGLVMLDPASLRAPRCGDAGYRLDIRDGALVGRDASGAVVCEGEALIDARLTITAGPARHRFRIANVGSVSTLHRDPQQRRVLPTYRFEWDDRRPVCPDVNARWLEPWQVGGLPGGRNPPGVGGALWQARTEHALIVQGETYDHAGNVDSARSSSRWFVIACAGAAFAKMRLFGYDPMDGKTTSDQRQTTLKMITARYKDGPSRTERGVQVLWLRAQAGPRLFGEPSREARDALGPVEAIWSAGGATCLSHLRLWRRTDPRFAWQADAEAASLDVPARCPTMYPELFELPANAEWITFTVNHVRHGGEPPIGPHPP